MTQTVKNAGDPGSTPGFGRSLGKEMVTHSNTLARGIHEQRSLGGYSPSMGWQRVEQD